MNPARLTEISFDLLNVIASFALHSSWSEIRELNLAELQWIYKYQSKRIIQSCSGWLMGSAARRGHLDIIQWLYTLFPDSFSSWGLYSATRCPIIIQWFYLQNRERFLDITSSFQWQSWM